MTPDIANYLEGIYYPADKQSILDQANSREADQDVLDSLQELPDITYQSPLDVSQAVSDLDVLATDRESELLHDAGSGLEGAHDILDDGAGDIVQEISQDT